MRILPTLPQFEANNSRTHIIDKAYNFKQQFIACGIY